MRTRTIQVTGQTIKRLQKLTEKTIIHQNLLAIHVTQIVKIWMFFFLKKNEWSLSKLQCNFKSNYVQISFFSNFIVF